MLRDDRSLTDDRIGASWLALALVSLVNTPFGTIYSLPGTTIVGVLLGVTMKASVRASADDIGPATKPEHDMAPAAMGS